MYIKTTCILYTYKIEYNFPIFRDRLERERQLFAKQSSAYRSAERQSSSRNYESGYSRSDRDPRSERDAGRTDPRSDREPRSDRDPRSSRDAGREPRATSRSDPRNSASGRSVTVVDERSSESRREGYKRSLSPNR